MVFGGFRIQPRYDKKRGKQQHHQHQLRQPGNSPRCSSSGVSSLTSSRDGFFFESSTSATRECYHVHTDKDDAFAGSNNYDEDACGSKDVMGDVCHQFSQLKGEMIPMEVLIDKNTQTQYGDVNHNHERRYHENQQIHFDLQQQQQKQKQQRCSFRRNVNSNTVEPLNNAYKCNGIGSSSKGAKKTLLQRNGRAFIIDTSNADDTMDSKSSRKWMHHRSPSSMASPSASSTVTSMSNSSSSRINGGVNTINRSDYQRLASDNDKNSDDDDDAECVENNLDSDEYDGLKSGNSSKKTNSSEFDDNKRWDTSPIGQGNFDDDSDSTDDSGTASPNQRRCCHQYKHPGRGTPRRERRKWWDDTEPADDSPLLSIRARREGRRRRQRRRQPSSSSWEQAERDVTKEAGAMMKQKESVVAEDSKEAKDNDHGGKVEDDDYHDEREGMDECEGEGEGEKGVFGNQEEDCSSLHLLSPRPIHRISDNNVSHQSRSSGQNLVGGTDKKENKNADNDDFSSMIAGGQKKRPLWFQTPSVSVKDGEGNQNENGCYSGIAREATRCKDYKEVQPQIRDNESEESAPSCDESIDSPPHSPPIDDSIPRERDGCTTIPLKQVPRTTKVSHKPRSLWILDESDDELAIPSAPKTTATLPLQIPAPSLTPRRSLSTKKGQQQQQGEKHDGRVWKTCRKRLEGLEGDIIGADDQDDSFLLELSPNSSNTKIPWDTYHDESTSSSTGSLSPSSTSSSTSPSSSPSKAAGAITGEEDHFRLLEELCGDFADDDIVTSRIGNFDENTDTTAVQHGGFPTPHGRNGSRKGGTGSLIHRHPNRRSHKKKHQPSILSALLLSASSLSSSSNPSPEHSSPPSSRLWKSARVCSHHRNNGNHHHRNNSRQHRQRRAPVATTFKTQLSTVEEEEDDDKEEGAIEESSPGMEEDDDKTGSYDEEIATYNKSSAEGVPNKGRVNIDDDEKSLWNGERNDWKERHANVDGSLQNGQFSHRNQPAEDEQWANGKDKSRRRQLSTNLYSKSAVDSSFSSTESTTLAPQLSSSDALTSSSCSSSLLWYFHDEDPTTNVPTTSMEMTKGVRDELNIATPSTHLLVKTLFSA